jgi:hypothetical protein
MYLSKLLFHPSSIRRLDWEVVRENHAIGTKTTYILFPSHGRHHCPKKSQKENTPSRSQTLRLHWHHRLMLSRNLYPSHLHIRNKVWHDLILKIHAFNQKTSSPRRNSLMCIFRSAFFLPVLPRYRATSVPSGERTGDTVSLQCVLMSSRQWTSPACRGEYLSR